MVLVFQITIKKKTSFGGFGEFKRGKLDKFVLSIRQCFAHLTEGFMILFSKKKNSANIWWQKILWKQFDFPLLQVWNHLEKIILCL